MSQFRLRKFIATGLFLGVMTSYVPALAQTNLESLSTKQETRSQALKITKVSHDIKERAINVGETLSVTIEGTEKVRASVLILGDKQRIREYQAQETTPGVYVAKIILSQRDRVTEGAIMARLQKGTQIVYGAASEPFTVNSRRNNQAISNSSETQEIAIANRSWIPLGITSHQNGEPVSKNGFKITGETEPNAEVQIKVAPILSLMGNLIRVEGETAVDRIINADSQGNFAIDIPKNFNAPQGLQYLVSAIAFSENGQSRTIELTLSQK